MSKIMKNGVEYGGQGTSTAYLAQRAVADQSGNDIAETYAKITDVDTAISGAITASNNAGLHNSFFRGKDITSKFTDGSLYTKIADGTFEDIYVGDYFTATINGSSVVCRIAGLDIYLNNGDTALTKHHAVIVPDTALMNAPMNSSNTTEGGYSGSKMRSETIVTVNGYLTSTFGSHLITCRELISTAVSTTATSAGNAAWTGAASNWSWVDSKADLMTEVEVYGSVAFSSSGYDVGTGKKQLPLFAHAPQFINPGRFNWWLRSVVNSAYFAHVSNYGHANYDGASHSRGVRPRWLIG